MEGTSVACYASLPCMCVIATCFHPFFLAVKNCPNPNAKFVVAPSPSQACCYHIFTTVFFLNSDLVLYHQKGWPLPFCICSRCWKLLLVPTLTFCPNPNAFYFPPLLVICSFLALCKWFLSLTAIHMGLWLFILLDRYICRLTKYII